MSIYERWERHHVTDVDLMKSLFEQDRPTVGGFDTETTGLHIKKDKPFLIVFGWFIPGEDHGRVFTFHPTNENMRVFHELASCLKAFIGWNVKYDLHMLANIGWDYTCKNLVEGMALARLSVEAIPARDGGDSLELTKIGAKYVDARAREPESQLGELKKKLKNERTAFLAAALRQFPMVVDGKTLKTYTGRVKHWGKQAVEDFLKDITNTIDDLPDEVREVWEEWRSGLEDPDEIVTYKDIYERYPQLMIRYAQDDVITMLEYARKAYKTVAARKQMHILRHENNVILPLWRMERVGIRVDREYLKKSQVKVRAYILEKRKELENIAGEEVTCNQHERIKGLFKEKWGITLASSDKKAMKYIMKNEKGEFPQEAVRFAELVSILRTCEKWYSTYILRYLKLSEYDGRFYTQIAQASAVSGRVGSDSQQMPKDPLKTEEGDELFHVRKAFIPTDQGKPMGYNSIWYCDLSQVELRVAANYTLLISTGDENLCSAYMPFKCKHYKTGERYNHRNKEHRARWDELKPGHPDPSQFKDGIEDVLKQGWSVWVDEEGNPWVPTDVHSETTKNAYHISEDHPEFKKLRGKGKSTNFLCLYGGGPAALADSLDTSFEEAKKLYEGYKAAFPMLDVYSQVVMREHRKHGYVANMYGRRYYLRNPHDAYKLANYLIQGTCADDMKRIIIEVDKLLIEGGYKSRLILTIHDEIQIELWKGEEHLIPKILDIMGDIEWSLVPIISDAEVTYTNWAEAKTANLDKLKKGA